MDYVSGVYRFHLSTQGRSTRSSARPVRSFLRNRFLRTESLHGPPLVGEVQLLRRLLLDLLGTPVVATGGRHVGVTGVRGR